MSQPNSANREENRAVQKRQLNVYTVMLIIAFFAIATASLLFYLELRRWGSFPWWKAETGAGAAVRLDLTDGPSYPAPCLKPGPSRAWS